MRVKLVKVKTWMDYQDNGDYYENYSDVLHHVTEAHSDWEDIDDLTRLETFVEEYNADKTRTDGSYLLIAYEPKPMLAKEAIDTILQREEEKMRLRKEELEKERIAREKRLKETAEEKKRKKLERAQKQLEKLKKELGEA